MTARQRRLVVFVATTVALFSALGAVAANAWPSGNEDYTVAEPVAAGVLSPRRAPEAFARLVADTRLSSRVNAVMRSVPGSSCVVVRAEDSTVLALRPDQLLLPASALKLTTAAAFLREVGGTGHFTTKVEFPGPDRSGSVPFLFVTGGGDPLLATNGYVATRKHPPKPFTDVTQLVAKLREAGVRHVGAITVNDDLYDAERRVPTWSAGYTQTGDVGPIGALAFNDGFSAYTPRLIAAPDPALAFGDELRAELVAAGIAVDDATTRHGNVPSGALSDVTLSSPSYARVVTEMLTESDNNTAESLLKRLASLTDGHATRPQGVAARAAALEKLGIDPKGVQAVDGSGLDRADRASCAALLATLTARPRGYDLATMLATAGRTGTLDDRFLTSPLAGKLRAKTGSLDGVTALVGIADPSAPVKIRFAFVANGAFSDAGGKALQDRLVAALATYPEAPPASALAP